MPVGSPTGSPEDAPSPVTKLQLPVTPYSSSRKVKAGEGKAGWSAEGSTGSMPENHTPAPDVFATFSYNRDDDLASRIADIESEHCTDYSTDMLSTDMLAYDGVDKSHTDTSDHVIVPVKDQPLKAQPEIATGLLHVGPNVAAAVRGAHPVEHQSEVSDLDDVHEESIEV